MKALLKVRGLWRRHHLSKKVKNDVATHFPKGTFLANGTAA